MTGETTTEPSPAKKRAAQKKEKKAESARIAEAVDFKLQGAAYEQIAEQMNISVKEAVRLVHEGIAALVRDPRDQQLLLDLQRTDQMIAAIYSAAVAGDQDAIRTVLTLRREREVLELKLQRQESFAALAPTEDEE